MRSELINVSMSLDSSLVRFGVRKQDGMSACRSKTALQVAHWRAYSCSTSCQQASAAMEAAAVAAGGAALGERHFLPGS